MKFARTLKLNVVDTPISEVTPVRCAKIERNGNSILFG